MRCTIRRTSISGFVSAPRTRLMRSLRSFGVSVSDMPYFVVRPHHAYNIVLVSGCPPTHFAREQRVNTMTWDSQTVKEKYLVAYRQLSGHVISMYGPQLPHSLKAKAGPEGPACRAPAGRGATLPRPVKPQSSSSPPSPWAPSTPHAIGVGGHRRRPVGEETDDAEPRSRIPTRPHPPALRPWQAKPSPEGRGQDTLTVAPKRLARRRPRCGLRGETDLQSAAKGNLGRIGP